MMRDLKNKNILVTGASSGIGRETCKKLSQYGANVIMIARREDKLLEVLDDLEGEGHSIYPFDLACLEDIESLITQIVAEKGKLDGFVHSAGLGNTRALNQTTIDFLHDVMKVNFYSFVEIVRVYAKKKNNNGGSIVVVSSAASRAGDKAKTAYCASKAAVDGAVRAMAVELKSKGIRVNSVQPGWVKTEMMEKYLEDAGLCEDDIRNRSAKIEIVTPEEIANAIVFLLSDMSRVLSGVSLLSNKVGP